MDNIPKLSEASNTFLQEINDQLPGEARLLFETVLSQLSQPSKSEYALQAVANSISARGLQNVLEDLLLDGELEREHLDALHTEYPSIFPEKMYEYLLSILED